MAFRLNINIRGLQDFTRMADATYTEVQEQVDRAVERRALLIVNDIKQDAPRKTGRLANSFDIVPQYTQKGQRAIGSEIEYATRQEYEHATKKGFVRNNIARHDPLLENDLRDAVNRGMGGS